MMDAWEDFSRYGIAALTNSTKPMTSIEKLLCQCSVSPSMCIGDAIEFSWSTVSFYRGLRKHTVCDNHINTS